MKVHNRWKAVLLTGALFALPAPSTAQSASDISCLLVSNLTSTKAADPKARAVGQAATYFYLGRVNPTMTSDQLKVIFSQQRKALTGKNVGPIMNACVKAMQMRAKTAQEAGQASSIKR